MYSCDDELVKIKTEPLDNTDEALMAPNYGDFVKDHFAASDSLFGDANENDFVVPLLQPKEEPPDVDYDALPRLSPSLPPISSIIKLEKEDDDQNVWPFSPLTNSAMVSIPNLLLSESLESNLEVKEDLTAVVPIEVKQETEDKPVKVEEPVEKLSMSRPSSPLLPKQDHKLICSQCNAQYTSVKEFVKHYRSHKEAEQQQEQNKNTSSELKKSASGKKVAKRKASERACRVCGAEFQSFNELVNHFLGHYNLSLNNATPKQMRTLRLKEIIPMSPPASIDQEIEKESASSSSEFVVSCSSIKKMKKEMEFESVHDDELSRTKSMTHHESRSLLKPMCNIPVTQPKVQSHDSRHLNVTTVKPKTPATKPAKKHICTICGLEFATMSPLVAHFLTHRNLKLNQKQASTLTPPAPVIYSCNMCNYQCTAASRLRQHQETHIDQPQVCSTCNKAFRTQRLLDQHITRQHVKIECKECGQTFLKRNDMVEHYLKHFDLTLKKQH